MKRAVYWSPAALGDFVAQIAYLAAENPAAARHVADQIRETCDALGEMTTSRPGRVRGTYEKLVVGRPYIIACAVADQGGREAVSILRVIHAARDGPRDAWP